MHRQNLAPSPSSTLAYHLLISLAYLVCEIHVNYTRLFGGVIKITQSLVIFDSKSSHFLTEL